MSEEINWKRCLDHCQQNDTLAHEVLQLFDVDAQKIKSELMQASKKNDTKTVLHLVHKLHGGCAYCGVTALKAVVKRLEDDLIQNAVSCLVGRLHELYDCMDRVHRVIQKQAYC